jgi:predicted Zn-dependent protease
MTPRRNAVRRILRGAAALLLCLPLASCAINPATGKRQLMLISESQEIEIGKENDKVIVMQFGLYDDPGLQQYVSDLGKRLAANSERPHLDWTFRVLDDTLVNAFALPGGYIYVTRGILAHFNNEAELASVLGHEIGHVTARHGANQMSKAQLTQLGLGATAVATQGTSLQGAADLAGAAAGVIFLKFSRDDERQADDLGLRYLVSGGYDPHPMGEVFMTLERVGEEQGAPDAPTWMLTHPDPGNREQRISEQIRAMQTDFSGRAVKRDEYFSRIDGIVFGDNPRHGFFKDDIFYHPEMRFRLDYPSGWKQTNAREYVSASPPEKNAFLQLTISRGGSAEEALREFLGQQGISGTSPWERSVNGLPASGSSFSATLTQGAARGEVVFVEHRGNVYRLLGLSAASAWEGYRPEMSRSLRSFRDLTDGRMLTVLPRVLHVVTPDRPMSGEEFARAFDATAPATTLAVINGLDPASARFEAGQPYKVVQGGRIP